MLRIFLDIEVYPIFLRYFIVSFLNAVYYITSNDTQFGCPIISTDSLKLIRKNYSYF